MKKFLVMLMMLLCLPVSCFAAYPDLCQSIGCYKEGSLTKDVSARYGNWAKREVIFMAACNDKPSLVEIIRVSHPDNNGVVTKKIEIGIVNEKNPNIPDHYNLDIVYTKAYRLDSKGNVLRASLVEVKTSYEMIMNSINDFRLELWMGPVGNASPRVIDEISLERVTGAPPEEMDEDLQKFWNVYR